jgi:hypothetical protein
MTHLLTNHTTSLDTKGNRWSKQYILFHSMDSLHGQATEKWILSYSTLRIIFSPKLLQPTTKLKIPWSRFQVRIANGLNVFFFLDHISSQDSLTSASFKQGHHKLCVLFPSHSKFPAARFKTGFCMFLPSHYSLRSTCYFADTPVALEFSVSCPILPASTHFFKGTFQTCLTCTVFIQVMHFSMKSTISHRVP